MYRVATFAAFYVGLVWLPVASAQSIQEEAVRAATAVLNETMASPMNRIPQSMLQNASGVAIIPNVLKGSFIVGARRGHGLLFVREPDGWHAPVFITLTGGNIGWQVGVQSSDIILVIKTRKSIDGILSGKFTLGADAAAAAGPIGRQAAVGTDERLEAEVYSYSRSRGLFAGVSIDGSVLQVDRLATGAYYQSAGPGQPVVVPGSAQQLTQTVAAYAGSPPATGTPVQHHGLAKQYGAREADVLRAQLVELAPQLFAALDQQWKTYLALPASLFLEGGHTTSAELLPVLQRFDLVASDVRFRQLAARPEFQSVYGLLKHYQQSLSSQSAVLQLPPPPP